ncbi:DNA protecting protein DprA [Bombiscardovia nodaiensis]|uniref:DNA protecting protein DprA n=1 Tax=Bombiscardovia nodaiensis TaxID=2932181 RepID=A0ABN6SD49_9BIFI|nr:DNA protecting protein DprA [Bombiscardovia nodaiensis]
MTLTSPNQTPQLTDEAFARALLTYCIDSPDALLYAAVLGASTASSLLEAVYQLPSPGRQAGKKPILAPASAVRQLDEMFITGSARWGRRVSQQDVSKFHHSASKWRARLSTLPSSQRSDLEAWLTNRGAYWIIGPDSPCWPQQLGDLSIRSDWAPPLCLWGRGSAQALVSCPQPVAVVGSRNCNDYGRFVAHEVAYHAAINGHLVVSGGALGADANAHWGALGALRDGAPPPGRTVAVFAGGLNHMGPRHNQQLFQAIERQDGALISELCPDTIPEARRFLLRNRIIAALASVVVVSQARHRSGALNTASWAAELGREVYAAPGSIDNPENTGCNRLIHDGKAMILITATDASEICHSPHEPILQTALPTTDQPADSKQEERREANPPDEHILASQSQLRQPTRAGSHEQGKEQAGDEVELSELQSQILAALTDCRTQHLAATCDNVTALLGSKSPNPPSLQQVMQAVGAMDLMGIITVNDGLILVPKPLKPASRNAPSPQSGRGLQSSRGPSQA